MEKIIGKNRYIGANNDNIYTNIELKRTTKQYKDENINLDISEYDIFLEERRNCNNFLVYGKLEIIFDDFLNFKKNDWQLEIGYPTYSINDSSQIPFSQTDVSEITVSGNIDYQIYDTLLFNNNTDTIYTKILDITKQNDLIYIKVDTLKSLNGYKLYYNEFSYDKIFNVIENIEYFDNGISLNIFGEKIYQYSTINDINISNYSGLLNLPLNELYYRFKYIGNDYILSSKYATDIISKSKYSISELIDIEDNYNYYYISVNINTTNNIDNEKINESGSERVTSYVRDRNASSGSGRARIISNFPNRKEGDGFTIIENTLPFFMYNYNLITLKELGEINEGIKYSETEIPKYSMLFTDNTYKYRPLLDFEDTEEIRQIPFMNNKHYIFNDIKFFGSRIKPISKYQPLYYIDDIDNSGVSNMVNPFEKRLC